MSTQSSFCSPAHPRRVTVLGSTGSIGTQGLDVIAQASGLFSVAALAGGHNLRLLAEQAVAFRAELVGCATPDASALAQAISRAAEAAGVRGYRPELVAGQHAATEVAAYGHAEVVLNGITGAIGLEPTLAALTAGHLLALANKESLIIGGQVVMAAAAPGQIAPVDSEHSALAQALRSGTPEEVAKLIVTASGGPFFGFTREQLRGVTPAQALAHPTWDMGRVVTTNSATMVNKALEVIEAHLLFDIPLEKIEPVVHRQSIVHSMVEFIDGSVIAQASPPDMRLPIALGMNWPHRVPGAATPCDFSSAASWTFEPLDQQVFGAVELAKQAAAASGTHMAVYNAVNEVAVDAFHDGKIRFTDIVDSIHRALDAYQAPTGELSAGLVLETDQWARSYAGEFIKELAS
ncbi:1-deoxy-D-xylulose-5-phosphate reductoisomerase [Glutamicibacter sp. MNS18]|uniref:1-deoxy-D-xylulose-5-phosphate reductoisomerase n=1 Tax=Glutamicibacter sp. MNS18 TaxID=2989817 RepID=UPI002236B9EA|nr:1-deoxy-D-xylulose-5-phosphate reductoisomerase [Glutamicibacter sp. MNS18]MCW4465241.1 1-deoxy-D-xylulose-5-phosphate reductoisomerase [Glutamicibacter sp. MNS18]